MNSLKAILLHTTLAAAMLAAALSSVVGTAAEIGLSRNALTGTNPPMTVAAVVISGQIVAGDAKKVVTLLAEIKKTDDGHQLRRLLIHSPGGLVGEAIAIGNMLRADDVEVFLPQQTSCISACVLVLAGGARRTVVGRVGIDAPHFLRAAGPHDDIPALLEQSKQVMRAYFKSMGVAEQLADAMFAVPPGKVHFLSREELQKYRLQ